MSICLRRSAHMRHSCVPFATARSSTRKNLRPGMPHRVLVIRAHSTRHSRTQERHSIRNMAAHLRDRNVCSRPLREDRSADTPTTTTVCSTEHRPVGAILQEARRLRTRTQPELRTSAHIRPQRVDESEGDTPNCISKDRHCKKGLTDERFGYSSHRSAPVLRRLCLLRVRVGGRQAELEAPD